MSRRIVVRPVRATRLLLGVGVSLATLLVAVVGPTSAQAAPSSADRPAADRPAASSRPAYRPYAKLTEKDAPLRAGCHRYHYTYKATPPTDEWTINLSLRNPNGHGVAGQFLDSNSDPAQGHKTWLLCKTSTVSGRYHIKTTVTYNVDQFTSRTAPVKPVYFRLTKPNGTGR